MDAYAGASRQFNYGLGGLKSVPDSDLPVQFCPPEQLEALNGDGAKISLLLTTPYCAGAFGPLAARNTYLVEKNQNLTALSPVKPLDGSQEQIAAFLAKKDAFGCVVDQTLINYQVEQIIEQKKVYSRSGVRGGEFSRASGVRNIQSSQNVLNIQNSQNFENDPHSLSDLRTLNASDALNSPNTLNDPNSPNHANNANSQNELNSPAPPPLNQITHKPATAASPTGAKLPIRSAA